MMMMRIVDIIHINKLQKTDKVIVYFPENAARNRSWLVLFL